MSVDTTTSTTNSTTIEFDQERANEYDRQRAAGSFSKEFLNQLEKYDWYHTTTTATATTATTPVLNILDFGCGTGVNAIGMAQHGHYVHGVDVSQDMLNQFQAKLQPKNENENNNDKQSSWMSRIQLSHLTSTNGILPPDMTSTHFFDLIVISLVLHHVPDPFEILSNLIRHNLKSGGRILIFDFEHTERSHALRSQLMKERLQRQQSQEQQPQSTHHAHHHHHHHSQESSNNSDTKKDAEKKETKEQQSHSHHNHEHHDHHHHHDHPIEWLDREKTIECMIQNGLEIIESKLLPVELPPTMKEAAAADQEKNMDNNHKDPQIMDSYLLLGQSK